MATQTIHHARCNSLPLPSRQHPLVAEVNGHLDRLRASEATSTSSSSISHKLHGFQDLYECVDKLLQLPLSQHALAQQPRKEWVDALLDGSLRLLDLCGTAKDVVLQMKESTNELQSVLRRRNSGELELVSEVKKYLTSSKVVKKTIHKALGNLKGMQTKPIRSPSEDHETKAIVTMLREVEEVTSFMFENLLSLISGPKPGSWSLVSKLLHQKRITCEGAGNLNEFQKVDAALKSLVSLKMSKSENIKNVEVQNQLKDLELSIQDLEDGLNCLFRCMIKARVSLLNIFTS